MTLRWNLWIDAISRLKKDRLALFCLMVIIVYGVLAVACSFGFFSRAWELEVGPGYQPPSLDSIELWFGTDIFGRSVLYKVIYGARIAMEVGIISTLISFPIAIFMGSIAGYFGGWIDEIIVWFYTTVSSIPGIMLLVAFSFVLGKGIFSVYLAIGLTSWVGLCRVIRGEFIKHKNREYVQAARSIGTTHFSRIFKHIFPNVFHQVVISFSIQFQSAIKSEVILSYLGIGVQGRPSWGIMIDDAKLELGRGIWWQLGASTMAIFFLVLSFNIFGDAVRDALDPKLK